MNSTKFASWLQGESNLNGLQSPSINPWHIVIEYDQFDQDGDNIHSGVIEESWAGPKEYKISYSSDNLHQTDYATEKGLFRSGDQRWPNRAETQARTEIVDPFHYAATLDGFTTTMLDRTFGPHTLHCAILQRKGGISVPTQYCFESNASVLRYSRGEGWNQTAYNDIVSLDGHAVARDVEITDGGHPFLRLHVKALNLLPHVDEGSFIPPSDAVNLTGKPVTGVPMQPIRTVFPEWPDSLRQQHFKVTVEIIIGKDGKVISAHAAGGPPTALTSAEAAVKKWVFKPYLVLGEPVEVLSRVELSND